MWQVVGTAELDGVCTQIPIFFLASDIQGIPNAPTAEKVAADVLNPFHNPKMILRLTITFSAAYRRRD